MSQCIFAFKEINPIEVGKLYATPNFSIPCYKNEFTNIKVISIKHFKKHLLSILMNKTNGFDFPSISYNTPYFTKNVEDEISNLVEPQDMMLALYNLLVILPSYENFIQKMEYKYSEIKNLILKLIEYSKEGYYLATERI